MFSKKNLLFALPLIGAVLAGCGEREISFKKDVILGHENVGLIDSLGKGVTHDYVGNPVKEGDRVILDVLGKALYYLQPYSSGVRRIRCVQFTCGR